MRKVSFDFDGTLTRHDVQRYAKELTKKGFDLYITTARCATNVFGQLTVDWNEDLFLISDRLKIPRQNIIFCDCDNKANHLPTGTLFHLDDDQLELELIKESGMNIGIDVTKSNWQRECHYKLY